MRIVGGKLKGRTLNLPKASHIRPTTDRVREAIFNILSHNDYSDLDGAFVLDLFAGTGALGFEALSRGAKYCLFVENEPNARAIIRQNIDAYALHGVTKIFRRDATNLGDTTNPAQYQFAFLDPPYRKGYCEKALAALDEGGWLEREALIIAEENAAVEITIPQNYSLLEKRTYGDTSIWFLRYSPQTPPIAAKGEPI